MSQAQKRIQACARACGLAAPYWYTTYTGDQSSHQKLREFQSGRRLHVRPMSGGAGEGESERKRESERERRPRRIGERAHECLLRLGELAPLRSCVVSSKGVAHLLHLPSQENTFHIHRTHFIYTVRDTRHRKRTRCSVRERIL